MLHDNFVANLQIKKQIFQNFSRLSTNKTILFSHQTHDFVILFLL
jgi:hypothetical protein